MKVCQLCAVEFTLDRFLLPLVDGMQAAGWDVTCVCSDGESFLPGLRAKGYQIENVPVARSMNPIAHLRAIVELTRLFRRHRFDVVHVHTPVAALVGRIAARMARVPLVVYTAHGFYFHDQMPRWKRRFHMELERFAGRFTDLLFTQSAEDAATAAAERFVPAESILAIGNGVDVARFTPAAVETSAARREFGIPADAFLIGMIGRHVREKGVSEFLEAAVRVGVEHPNARFMLIGDRLTSDHSGSVEADVARARAALGDRLIVTGFRRDTPELLAAMDVFCLPSWREGMPRTIIEAMMMAKPVIATDIRGAREEVVPEATGLLVPTRAPEQLAAAMIRLLHSPDWARQLGAAGRRRALDHYDERKIVLAQIAKIRERAHAKGLSA